MRKFATKTILFSLPVLAVMVAMEILLRNIPNDYTYKRDYLDKNSSAIETLLLGNSLTYYGLNPAFFSGRTYNASHVSQSLKYDFEILKKYQFSFDSLKTVVVRISYTTLYGKLEEGNDSWRVKNYIIYYGMNTSDDLRNYSEVLSNRFNVNMTRLYSYYVLGKSAIW